MAKVVEFKNQVDDSSTYVLFPAGKSDVRYLACQQVAGDGKWTGWLDFEEKLGEKVVVRWKVPLTGSGRGQKAPKGSMGAFLHGLGMRWRKLPPAVTGQLSREGGLAVYEFEPVVSSLNAWFISTNGQESAHDHLELRLNQHWPVTEEPYPVVDAETSDLPDI